MLYYVGVYVSLGFRFYNMRTDNHFHWGLSQVYILLESHCTQVLDLENPTGKIVLAKIEVSLYCLIMWVLGWWETFCEHGEEPVAVAELVVVGLGVFLPDCCYAQAGHPFLMCGRPLVARQTTSLLTLVSITSWALAKENIFTYILWHFCRILLTHVKQDGDFSAAVATWGNRSVSQIICQAGLLSVQGIFNHVTFKTVPHLQWH